MDLVRDILDEQVVDREGHQSGKVDGIVLELEDEGPPRVAAIAIGPVTLGRRLHPRLGRWIATLERRLGVGPGEEFRVPFDKVRQDEKGVRADIDRDRSPAFNWERWVRRHLVGRIPGSGL